MDNNDKKLDLLKNSSRFDNKLDIQRVVLDDEDEETKCLLSPQKRGGIAKNPKKERRKVQWNDRTGNKLVEILEFQPSDTSDSDDDDLDSCICTVM